MSARRTYHGSCHCQYARFTVQLELSDPPKATRCNCTICQKTGWTALEVAPSDFQLLVPAAEDQLRDYRYNNTDIHRFSCPKCSVYLFDYGTYELQGQQKKFFTINLNAMDQPQQGLDLSEFVLSYYDGLHDNWSVAPANKPFSGGTV